MEERTILIVEDDQDLREALKTALMEENFTVLEAHDGEEGYQMALEHHPDVTLLDIMMPKMDGHEALKRIRNDQWGKDARIVFLTSLSDAENVVHAVESGGEEYIVKSHVSLKELIAKMKQIIHGYNL